MEKRIEKLVRVGREAVADRVGDFLADLIAGRRRERDDFDGEFLATNGAADAIAAAAPAPSARPAFDDLRREYSRLWAEMAIRRERLDDANAIADRILGNRSRYVTVATATGVPWYVVGLIHTMESGLSFGGHLHNGDPLTARTVQVPAGRPRNGEPPFTWEESAIDALSQRGFSDNTDWSVERIAFLLEGFNGWGYRRYHPEVKSPYLWSFSNHYAAGKYVADGKWSATAVSGQCGAMVVLKQLEARGAVHLTIGWLQPDAAADAHEPHLRHEAFEDDRDVVAEPEAATFPPPRPVPTGDPVPFAVSPTAPANRHWPVITSHPDQRLISYDVAPTGSVGSSGRKFLALRNNGARHHVAIDLYARRGDRVVACEDGRIVNYYPFYPSSAGDMSYALLVEHAGFVINYGEVTEGADGKFGWRIGDRVQGGQVLAEISGTAMLHFETYVTGTTRSQRWMVGGPRPSVLLNPTRYLLEIR